MKTLKNKPKTKHKKREQLPAAPACLHDLRPELHHFLSWNCNHLPRIEAHCTSWFPLFNHKRSKTPQKHILVILQCV